MPRERKDLATHKLQGTKPEYVLPSAEVKPGRPRFPKGISPDARRVFKHVARLLEARRSLSEGDGELIRLLVIAYDRHATAVAKLATEGEIKTYFRLDKHGESVPSEKENLWLKVATDAEKFMVGCYDRLGLTPMNRAKIKPTEEPKTKDSALPGAELLTREPVAPAEPEIDLNSIREDLIQ